MKANRAMLGRSVHRTVIFYLIIAASICQSGCLARHDIAHQSNASSAKPSWTWKPLHCHGRTIDAVGSTRLLAPVTLPIWLRPLGNEALFENVPITPNFIAAHERPKYALILYFDANLTGAVQKWLRGFPKGFVLPAKSFSLRSAMTASGTTTRGSWGGVCRRRNTDGRTSWSYYASTNVPRGKTEIIMNTSFESCQMPVTPEEKQVAEAIAPGFLDAQLGTGSPIKHKGGLIQMIIDYDVKI